MRRAVRAGAWAVAAAAVPLVVALVFLPGRRGLALDLFLLLVGGCAVLALVRSLAETAPLPEPEPPLPQDGPPGRLPQLERTERAVLLAGSSAFDVHFRLRPILREIATQRLATRRGLTLDHDGDAARAVLGEDAWELVRPDREPPHLRHGPGIATAELREVVAALERI